jgi:hypothetical protein
MEPTMPGNSFLTAGPAGYTPSGRFGAAGIPLGLFFGAAAGAALGMAHGYITQYNRYIYLNFIATFAVGLLIGAAVMAGVRMGKVRAPKLAAALGAAGGLVGLYCAWVAWIHVLLVRSGVPGWAVDPASLWRAIVIVNANGAWSLGDLTPTGASLWILWSLEAVIIVGIAAAVPWVWVGNNPFCEPCDAWAVKEIREHKLGPAMDLANLKQALMELNLKPLSELGPATPALYTEIELYVCPKCRQVGFLTVRNVTVTGKKNKQNVIKTDVVKNLTLGAEGIERVKVLAPAAPTGSSQS